MDPSGSPYPYPWIWKTVLPAVPASFTPFTLTVKSATMEATISDVLFGKAPSATAGSKLGSSKAH